VLENWLSQNTGFAMPQLCCSCHTCMAKKADLWKQQQQQQQQRS